MNANAYGGQLAEVLEWVEVTTAAGTERRAPDAFDFVYRNSNLGAGEVVSRASFALTPGDPDEIRATLASMRGRRREAQPSGIKTFGSTFKNPDDERAEGRSAGQLLEAAGCRGLAHGGARFSEKHANFVENTGEATTADVLALMAEGRRRVKEKFGVELEPEVQVLGDVEVPGWRRVRRIALVVRRGPRGRRRGGLLVRPARLLDHRPPRRGRPTPVAQIGEGKSRGPGRRRRQAARHATAADRSKAKRQAAEAPARSCR